MKEEYQITDRRDSRALARFLSDEGQALLPMLELIEQAEMAVDELIDVAGRATIEAGHEQHTIMHFGIFRLSPPFHRYIFPGT